MFKKTEPTKKSDVASEAVPEGLAVPQAPDPELAAAAAKGDPLAAALATEVAKDEERHPATKAVMAARAEDKKAESKLAQATRGLLAVGRHAALCPAQSHHLQPCACGWGSAEAEALLALGDAPSA